MNNRGGVGPHVVRPGQNEATGSFGPTGFDQAVDVFELLVRRSRRCSDYQQTLAIESDERNRKCADRHQDSDSDEAFQVDHRGTDAAVQGAETAAAPLSRREFLRKSGHSLAS